MVTERRGEDNSSNNKLIPQSLVPLPNTIDKKIVKEAIENVSQWKCDKRLHDPAGCPKCKLFKELGLVDPEFVKVKSSNISGVSYDNDKLVLTVAFLNGNKYVYENVESKVYRDFLDSESKGSFLRSNIVDIYESKKVEKSENI